MQNQGVFAKEGFFDSVNLAFWDPNTRAYRAYFRDARRPAFVRDIKTGTSPDFRRWTPGQWLSYTSTPSAQFYTNGIRPYHRAPHLYLGFPACMTTARGRRRWRSCRTPRSGGKTWRSGSAPDR
jgi:hypothetical protein